MNNAPINFGIIQRYVSQSRVTAINIFMQIESFRIEKLNLLSLCKNTSETNDKYQ
jgi:hypothetical protein